MPLCCLLSLKALHILLFLLLLLPVCTFYLSSRSPNAMPISANGHSSPSDTITSFSSCLFLSKLCLVAIVRSLSQPLQHTLFPSYMSVVTKFWSLFLLLTCTNILDCLHLISLFSVYGFMFLEGMPHSFFLCIHGDIVSCMS